MDSVYSPASFQSETSTPSTDGSNIPPSQQILTLAANTPTINEGQSTDNNRAHAKRMHRDIETRRRNTESRHMDELSALITHWSDDKPSRLFQFDVLQRAADLLDLINQRDQYETVLPSYLTRDETNFLNLEASQAFLFMTTIEPSFFRVIHVTNSIRRILHLTPEQWLGQNLFSLIHLDDVLQIQSQLLSLTQQMDKSVSIKCRLQQENGSYLLVTIDGMIKKLNQTLKPVGSNEHGSFAFVGICHLPLTSQYNETNMSLYKDTQSLILSCRCSPNDWKVFLVDRSVSTFPSISFNVFRNRSILEFIHHNDHSHVQQALLKSTVTHQDQSVTCHLMYSPTKIFTMALKIKPFVQPRSQRINFIELTFTNTTDLVTNTNNLEVY